MRIFKGHEHTAMGASRLAAPATLATVISKVPSYEAEQPAGAEACGAMAEVTPWARVRPAVPTMAARRVVDCMLLMGLRCRSRETKMR